jgi:hypothetical protein
MELIRDPGNDTKGPLVGSNVTLICRISNIANTSTPEWSLKRNEAKGLEAINQMNPPKGQYFSFRYNCYRGDTLRLIQLMIQAFK